MDTEKRKRPQWQSIRGTHLYGVLAFFSAHRDPRAHGRNTQNALYLLFARSYLYHRLFPFGDFARKKSGLESSVFEEAVSAADSEGKPGGVKKEVVKRIAQKGACRPGISARPPTATGSLDVCGSGRRVSGLSSFGFVVIIKNNVGRMTANPEVMAWTESWRGGPEVGFEEI